VKKQRKIRWDIEKILAGVMSKSMYRYEVPIDDQSHTIHICGEPLYVSAQTQGTTIAKPVMEFWAEHNPGTETAEHTFQVFGTGHPLPDKAYYVGTAPRIGGLVFHLYELTT
jgi:hypothetical protein